MKKYLLFVIVVFSLFFVSPKAAQISSSNFSLSIGDKSLPFTNGYGSNSNVSLPINLYSF